MIGGAGGEASGWTTDTLHQHLRTVLDNQHGSILATIEAACHAHDQRFTDINTALAVARDAAEKAIVAGDFQVEQRFVGIEKLMATQLADMKTMLDERYNMQAKAVEAALASVDRATDTRATAQEREFHEHLNQYRNEVSTAFASSDRAITKAELATEKRFEQVNGFRAQLAEQAGSFTPRLEFEGQVHSLRIEQQTAASRNAERIQELADRLNRSEGKGDGMNAGWVYLLGALAAVGTIVSLYVAFKTGG